MDPTTALFELLSLMARPAVTREERQHVEDTLAALRSWVQRGGFMPTVHREGNTFTVNRRS